MARSRRVDRVAAAARSSGAIVAARSVTRRAGAAPRRRSSAPARRAGCRGARTRPCSLASETTRVPQPKIRSIRPISKSTPLIRLSGMVRPSLAMKPGPLDEAPVGEGVGRGGPGDERPDHEPPEHDDGRPAPRPRGAGLSAACSPARRVGRRRRPRGARPGRAAAPSAPWGACACETTTCSPSLRSLSVIATRRSCHPAAAHVHDVAGGDRGASDHEPAGPRRRRWPARSARHRPGRLDPDLAAQRHAGLEVVAGAARSPPPADQASYSCAEAGQQATRAGPCGPGAAGREHGRTSPSGRAARRRSG